MMSKKNFIIIAIVMVLLGVSIVCFAVWAKKWASQPRYYDDKILPIDKSIVQIINPYQNGSTDFVTIGNEDKNIKISDLAVELKKYHTAHPNARYQVVSFGNASISEITGEFKKAGIEIKHYWTPCSALSIYTRVTEDGRCVMDMTGDAGQTTYFLMGYFIEV